MTTTADRLRSYWGDRQFDRAYLTSLAARYWEVAIFAALVGVALGLRLWGLGDRAVHHDEALHMFYAWELAEGKGYEHVPFMHGPFQFFISAAIFKVFTDTDFTARLAYAVFGSALVAMPFFLRGFLGRWGAIIAAVLLAFSPSLLYFSRFARNDIYIAVFTLGMVIAMWRYMREQKEAFLYAIPLLMMLGFATKEVTFLTTTIFLIYLEIQLASDFVDQIHAKRDLDPVMRGILFVVLIPTAWLIAILWPLLQAPRRRWSLETLPPSGHLAILIGTFALPQFAAGVEKIPFVSLGSADVYDPGADETLRITTTLIFLFVAAYIGLLWNWRVWSVCAAIFYVPFVLLYTTGFTNMGGFWTGIWGSLDYWLSQQLVRRGNQPDYYYLMTVPVYEFLPLIFALGGALYYSFKGKLDQKLLAAAAVVLTAAFSVVPESWPLIGGYHVHASFLTAIVAVVLLQMEQFTKFLLFWTLSIFFALTVSGEKMPWLTVHLALPLVLLAARTLDDLLTSAGARDADELEAEEEDAEEENEASGPSGGAGLPLERLLPLAYGGVFALGAALVFQAYGPANGISAVAWLLSLGALGVVVWMARSASWQAAGQVAGVALFAALLVFTVRAGATAAFDEGEPGGYPQEILIYAQGSPQLSAINDDIDRLARQTGLGDQLPVVIDNSVNVWPWPWYLRGDPQRYTLENFDGEFVPPPGAVVLISINNQGKMQPYLDQYQDPIPYRHMWWFPEFYRGLETGSFLGDVFSGDLFPTWRRYLIDREVRGGESAPDMLAFFPINVDFVPDVPTQPGEAGPGRPLPEDSVTFIGTAGTELGQFTGPNDIAVDADGNVYVVDTLNHRIQRIAPDGEVTAVGMSGAGEGEFGNPQDQNADFPLDGPWGIAVDAGGNVYVADTWNHRVQVFDANLEFVTEFGAGTFFGPRDIAFDRDGNVLVVDTGNKRVAVYTPAGELLEVRGTPGSDPNQFNEPTSISVTPDGEIYVADYWNQRIQHFNADFQYIDEIAMPTWGAQGIQERAYIHVLDDGTILASDPGNARIIVLNAEGEETASWSLPSAIGTSRPIGITVGPDDQVYMTDSAASNVLRVALSVLLSPPAASQETASP